MLIPIPVPIDVRQQRSFLQSIQANILKPHGRKYVRLLLFRFADDRPTDRRAFFAEAMENQFITSADAQEDYTSKLAAGISEKMLSPNGRGLDGRIHPLARKGVYGFGLSVDGVNQLGLGRIRIETPGGNARKFLFKKSMRQQLHQKDADLVQKTSNDAATRGVWEKAYDDGVHGVWTLANAVKQDLNQMDQQITAFLRRHGARVVKRENGFRWQEKPASPGGKPGFDREPFGFQDGISNPEFIAGRVPANPLDWTRIPVEQVIVRTGGAYDGCSFLVLRKLEQNVSAFREFQRREERSWQDAGTRSELGTLVKPNQAGSPLVGREPGGQPLVSQPDPADPNRFSFAGEAARHCPFHTHIRKMYPRDTTVRDLPDGGRGAQFVRRGCIYDDSPGRPRLPRWAAANYPEGEHISQDLGLLFMGYMANPEQQFLTMHMQWSREKAFPYPEADTVDAILHSDLLDKDPQGTGRRWSWKSGGGEVESRVQRDALVRPRGGEYFFVPGIRWLRRQAS